MSTKVLLGLTIFIAIVVALSISLLDPERLASFGSILSGAGGLLAVIWFSAGLRYQSRQLEEQRAQFASQFQHLQEASRRDALLVARGILENAEARAISHNGKIKRIDELFVEYSMFAELKPILESTDPGEVMRAFQDWMKKEGAALAFLSGVKSAAEIYLKSCGVTDIDYTKSPDEFYFVYSPRFESQPYFNSISGTARLLAEFMVRLAPGRNAAVIAFFAASARTFSRDIVKMDELRKDMEKHVADGYQLPKIAVELWPRHKKRDDSRSDARTIAAYAMQAARSAS